MRRETSTSIVFARSWITIGSTCRLNIAQALKTHVRENDFPIALRQWNLLASAGGLCPACTVLKTPDRLFQLVAHFLAD